MQFNGMKKSSLPGDETPSKKPLFSSNEGTVAPKNNAACDNLHTPANSDINYSDAGLKKKVVKQPQTGTVSEPEKSTVATDDNNTFQTEGNVPSLDGKRIQTSVDLKKLKKTLIPAAVVLLIIIAVAIVAPKISNFVQVKKEAQQRKEAISLCLEEAKDFALDGEYEKAVKEIEECLSQYGDSDELNSKLEEYTDSLNQQAKEAAVEAIEEKAAAGDYKNAIELLNSAVAKYGSISALDTLRLDCVEKYSSSVLEEAQNLLDQREYAETKKLLADATNLVSDDEKINKLKEYVDQYKVIPLNRLSSVNGGFSWNVGVAEDPFGNNYSDVCNFFIFHGDSCGMDYVESVEYKLDGVYDTMSFQISPYKDFGEDAESYIQIYADNALVYTSPRVQRKSGLQKVTLDIHDAEYLKIVINKGEDGCVLFSDVVMSESPEYVNNYDEDIISLSTLETLNGGFPWDCYYPEDPYESDYTRSCNYVVYHGSFCSGSFSTSSEYKLSGEYEELSFKIAPYKDYKMNAKSYVQVYVDNVVKYTSPLIALKGGVYDVKVDVKGAEYLKIVINKDDYGCVLLSDMTLKKTAEPSVSPDKTTEYLTELSPLNGGNFEWNIRYPQNITKDDYSLSRNYCVFHGAFCSGSFIGQAEYFLDGKYKTFSLDFAPYSDFGKNANSSIAIYADDKEIFSESINQKSAKTSTGELDIIGVSYLKIVVEKGDYGCVIISDAKLGK